MNNPLIIIAGDFNRHKVNDFLVQFHDIEENIVDGTRLGVALDRCFSNLDHLKHTLRPPLSNESGTKKSDHMAVHMSTKLQNVLQYKKRDFVFKKYTDEGARLFKDKITVQDWTSVLTNREDPHLQVKNLDTILQS